MTGQVDIKALYDNREETIEIIGRYKRRMEMADAGESMVYEHFIRRLMARLNDIEYEIERREGKGYIWFREAQ
jgi:hypothetical protein